MESTQAFGHGLDDVNTPYNRPLKCRLLPRSPDGFEEVNIMGCHFECVTRIGVACKEINNVDVDLTSYTKFKILPIQTNIHVLIHI